MFYTDGYEIIRTILAGALTGNYHYGDIQYDYYEPADDYHEPHKPFALGAWTFYGNQVKDIVYRVYKMNPEIFRKKYPDFLTDDFTLDWSSDQYRPSNEQIDLLRKIMSSTLGIRYQTMDIDKQIRYCLASADSCGITSLQGQVMWVNFQMLGGLDAARRIFAHSGADASLEEIMAAIETEQFDKSSTTHIGNDVYGERHTFFADCIEKYILEERSNTKEEA